MKCLHSASALSCSFRLTWPYTSPPFWYLCGVPVPAHQSYLGWKFYCVWLPWYFFFIQLGQRVLQFALMDPSRSGLASTTPPFSKLPACLGHRQADVSDFALNSSSKSNLSENVPYLLYFHQALERDSREKWSWNDNPGPQIFSLSPAAAPAAQSVSPEPGRPIRGSIHGNIKLWHIL